MARWTQYDEDEHRLPEGMRCVGYDADTQKYSYQDEDGAYWEGPAGSRYGRLRRVGEEYEPDETEELMRREAHKRAFSDDWRYLAPFFMLICLFLLGVYTMLGGGDMIWGGHGGAKDLPCANGETIYKVSRGDSCWSIANGRGMTVKELQAANARLDCDSLKIGKQLCVSSFRD